MDSVKPLLRMKKGKAGKHVCLGSPLLHLLAESQVPLTLCPVHSLPSLSSVDDLS